MDKTAEVLLKYKVDQAEVTRAQAANNLLKQGYEQLRNVAQQAARFTQNLNSPDTQGVRNLVRGLDDAQDRLRAAVNLSNDLSDNLQRAGRAASSINTPTLGGAGVRGAAEGLDRVGAVGTQLLGGLGAGDAANAVGVLGDLGGAISSLTPAGLAATAGTAALAAILGEAARQSEIAAEAARAELNARREVAFFLQDATRQDVEERLRQVQQDLATERALQEQFNRERATFFQENIDQAGDFVQQLNNRLRVALGGIFQFADLGALNEQLATSSANVAELETQQRELEAALAQNVTASNDAAAALAETADSALSAAEAERRLAEERLALLDEQIQRAIENRRLIRDGTSSQLDSAEARLNDEIQVYANALRALEEQIRLGTLSGEDLNVAIERATAYRDTIQDLNTELSDIETVVRPAVEARERETEAIRQQQAALDESARNRDQERAQRQRDAEQRQRDAQRAAEESRRQSEQLARQREQSNQRIADSRSRIEELRASGRNEELDILREGERAKAEQLRAFGVEQQRAVEDTQLAIVRILRNAQSEQADAVANRDAVSFVRSQRAARQQEQQERENASINQRRRAEDFAAQQAQEAVQLAARLEQQRAANQQAIAQEEAKIRQELEAQRRAAQQSIAAAQNALAQKLSVEKNGYQQSLALAQGFANNLSSAIGRISNVASKQTFTSSIGTQPRITVAPTINISGANQRQVQQTTLNTLSAALAKANQSYKR